MAARVWRGVGWVAKLVLRVVWVSTMVLTPLFGVWLASSLAAYRNASQWLALLIGLALFPIVPAGWELFFAWRRSKRPAVKSILTRLDRLVLRTLIVNGLFLGGMLWFAPETAFRAIAVRGDWMLDGYEGELADGMRSAILAFADHFEERWHKTDDRYGHSDQAPEHVEPPPARTVDAPAVAKPAYPVDPRPDLVVSDMPAAAQVSIESVGRYLAANIPDPRRRVKAVHDYVALRLQYDYVGLALIQARDYEHAPSQEAEAVFAARTGVCAGYAKLTSALGKAAGLEIAYVTGYIRDTRRRTTDIGTDDAIKAALEGYLHAWNAAKIDGAWQLLDATWDDPKDPAEPLHTTYLFTPPELFVRDHLPEDARWQLLAKPLTPGEFARQPFMTPFASSLGLVLVAPTRSLVTVDGDLTIVMDNPRGAEVDGQVRIDGSAENVADVGRCDTHRLGGTKIEIACHFGHGQFEVRLFGGFRPEHGGRYSLDYVGSILANTR